MKIQNKEPPPITAFDKETIEEAKKRLPSGWSFNPKEKQEYMIRLRAHRIIRFDTSALAW